MTTKDNLVMGKDCVYAMDENQVNNNVLVVGGTGSGKTHYVLEPMLLHTENSSVVVNINKRILFDKYAPLFAERGYKVLDLNLAHPEQGNVSFNILRCLKSDKDIRDFAKNLVEASVGGKDKKNDPFWDMAAANLLAFILRFTQDCYKDPDFNYVLCIIQELSKAANIFYMMKETDLTLETMSDAEKSTMDFLEKLDGYAEHAELTLANGYNTYRVNAPVTRQCIIASLTAAVDGVFSRDVLYATTSLSRELSIKDLGEEKTVLFITVPPLNRSTHIFANIIFGQIVKDLFEYAEDKCPNGELPVPVRLLFDDFACGSVIPGFDKTISIIRQKKISVTLLLQDLSQLSSMYGDNQAQTIVNNCDNFVYMGGMDEKSVSKVSHLANQPFEDIYYMPVNKIVVIRRGNQAAVFTSRYDTEQDDVYKKMLRLAESRKAGMALRRDQKLFG